MLRAALLSNVLCPGCRLPMAMIQAESIPHQSNLVSITYQCPSCQTETTRFMRCEQE